MNEAEIAAMNAARTVFSLEEVETLAGLIRLRHSPRAAVRIAANIELIPILSRLRAKISGVC